MRVRATGSTFTPRMVISRPPGALKALEEKLAAQPLARCNSGYLVNLAQVSGVQQSVVQVGPYELQISRPKRKSFLAALADFIGGEG